MRVFSSTFGNICGQVPDRKIDQRESPMRVRVSLKLLLVIIIAILAFTIFSCWTKCETNLTSTEKQWHFKDPPVNSPLQKSLSADVFRLDDWQDDQFAVDQRAHQRSGIRTLMDIDCSVNDEYSVHCLQDSDEIYVPFSFLHKYFEVYGKVVKHAGVERFDWQHSYSKVYFPKEKYDPSGVYLWFENYNVEVRDRVKCVSGIEGVPVSTQWDIRGHFYPIQIAQFGLSHFSKNLTEAAPSFVLLEDGDITSRGFWKTPEEKTKDIWLRNLTDKTVFSSVLEFKVFGGREVIFYIKDDLEEVTFNCDVMLISNASITVVLSSSVDHTLYRIHYVMSDSLLWSTDTDIYYGIGTNIHWKTLTRDLVIDLSKGLSSAQNRKRVPRLRNLHIRSISFRGYGKVDNISVTSASHMAHFFAAANWFVNHQDDKGGWPNMVTRKLSNGMLELAPGWYSAMAQGQGMSLLTRAFKVTGDMRYLESALNAIKLFSVRSENHGILTTFLGKFVWYEEYPTTPSSFVLNGFIYALFGLYDVHQSCTHEHCRQARQLYEEGLVSLKKMLPLFDTGSGSIYDLRHYSLGIAPNLARWDYHSTHINQLLFLSTVYSDPVLKSVAERWIGYMKGKRASHN